jgi:hypothetical protein
MSNWKLKSRDKENEMLKIKRDLPIYVLSASLIFAGITISTNSATAAYDPNSARISSLESQVSSLKSCLNRQLSSIGAYMPDRDRYIWVGRC